jgi:hypothetical protein
MKIDGSIPTSAASRNFLITLWFLVLGLVLYVFNLPSWILTLVFGISGAFLFSMVMCILDVQEFKMKQNQKIIELLSKIVNKNNNDN